MSENKKLFLVTAAIGIFALCLAFAFLWCWCNGQDKIMEINKIHLGDAYKLIKEVPDKSVDLIVTDPPYDIPQIHGRGIMKTRKAGSFIQEIADNSLDKGMDYSILDEVVRVMKKINCYIWCNSQRLT